MRLLMSRKGEEVNVIWNGFVEINAFGVSNNHSNQTLLPISVLLHEKIELHFAWLRKKGSETIEHLIRGLSTKTKIDDLAGNDES